MNTQATTLAILIVLYDCELGDSRTVQALCASTLSFDGVQLVVWNNGPRLLTDKDTQGLEQKGFRVDIQQTPSNQSLSHIYNTFIFNNSADYYVVLDHDSKVNDDYLNTLLAPPTFIIGVPVIKSHGAIRSPTIGGAFVDRPYTNHDNVVAIGSGLVLHHSLKAHFHKRYERIFDERYFLYGVDSTFFYRLKTLGLIEQIQVIPGFEHALSRLEASQEAFSAFRRMERSYDFGLTLRYYPSWLKLRHFIRYTKQSLLGRCKLSYYHIVKALITGRHYRA